MHDIERVRDLAQVLGKSVGENNLNDVGVASRPDEHEASKSLPTVRIRNKPHHGLVAWSDLRIPSCHSGKVKSDREDDKPEIAITLNSFFPFSKDQVDLRKEHAAKEEEDVILTIVSAVQDECSHETKTYSRAKIPDADGDEEKKH